MTDNLEPLGQLLADRYRVERELGSGGTATVYLAQDLKHHRKVALKILKPRVAAALGPERFLREIEISAQLNHPHVLPLHDSGQSDGLLYYVMPYVEGESLRDRLRHQKQLPVDEVLQLTREIADGLGYAHGLGIVHRDIKPENILLSGGHAVIADFGIAQALAAAGGSHLTDAGIIVGTPYYMSPEQARAHATPDERSDLYSLACVVYEMLAGEPPFTGADVRIVLARKAAGEVPSLRVVRSTAPPGMEAVLVKALAVVPGDRYASVRKFAEALARTYGPRRRVRSRVAGLIALVLALAGVGLVRLAPWKKAGSAADAGPLAAAGGLRVGVLPSDLGGVGDSLLPRVRLIQYLLGAELGRYRGLAVVDPLSLNSLLGGDEKPVGDPIGRLREWGVPYVVRVTLTPTSSGLEVLWVLTSTERGEVVETGSFTSTGDAELSSRIREAGTRLWESMDAAYGGIAKTMDLEPFVSRAPNVEALRAFLQGTEYAYRFLPGGREHFERALQIDPDFIAPRVWLVSGLLTGGDTAGARTHLRVLETLRPKATAFDQALIGWAGARAIGDLEACVRHLRVALAYSPHNNILLYNLGFGLLGLGRPAEAVAPIREAMESGWRYAQLYTLWGVVAIEAGEMDRLQEILEDALSITPPDPYIPGLLESLALSTGDTAAARSYAATFREQMGPARMAEGYSEMVRVYRSLAQRARERKEPGHAVLLLERAVEIQPTWPFLKLELARALAESGRRRSAELQYLSIAQRTVSDSDMVVPLLGEVALLVGRKDEARSWLQRYLRVAPEGPGAARARDQLRALTGSPRRE